MSMPFTKIVYAVFVEELCKVTQVKRGGGYILNCRKIVFCVEANSDCRTKVTRQENFSSSKKKMN
jgi:hypothetical protein